MAAQKQKKSYKRGRKISWRCKKQKNLQFRIFLLSFKWIYGFEGREKLNFNTMESFVSNKIIWLQHTHILCTNLLKLNSFLWFLMTKISFEVAMCPPALKIILKGLRQWRIKEWRGEQVMRNIYESFYLPSSISIQRGSGRSSSNIIGEWYNFQFNIYNAIKILFETFSSSSSLFAHKCRRRRWKILDMKAGNHVRQMKIKTK